MVLNDSRAFSAGLFLETQVTSNLRVRIAGGYQQIDFDDNGSVTDAQDVDDYYANLVISHRVNSVLTQNLAIGHENQLGVNSNYLTLNYIRHTTNWNILYHTLLSTELFYEESTESGGMFTGGSAIPGFNPFAAEDAHRYGGALAVGYQLTPHVTLGLRYQYTQKDSNLPLRDYRQNRIGIDGTYSF
jgi:opacity protein-like surface antigen